jgi:hypothetical protein
MPLPKEFAYLELTPTSKSKLEKVIPYKYELKYGDFITLDWDTDFRIHRKYLGKEFRFNIDKIYFDEKIEAIPVELAQLPFNSVNKKPHITWSGIKNINPYYSNYMLYTSDKFKNFEKTEIQTILKIDKF